MQRPCGVGQMRPRDRTQVCTAGSDDGIHMIAFEDIADGNGANAHFVPDLIGEWDLKHAPVDRSFRFAHLPGGTINYVRSCFFEEPRDSGSVIRCKTTGHPVMGRDTHAHGTILRPGGTHSAKNLQRTAAAVLQAATILISALID